MPFFAEVREKQPCEIGGDGVTVRVTAFAVSEDATTRLGSVP